MTARNALFLVEGNIIYGSAKKCPESARKSPPKNYFILQT